MFDTKSFLKAKFKHSTGEVKVPKNLHEFFKDEKGKPEKNPSFKVQGMEGKDLGYCREYAERNNGLLALIETLKSAKVEDKTEALKTITKMAKEKKPADIAFRLELFMIGCVEPKPSLDIALKVCKVSAKFFYAVTDKISDLTGQGMEPGKR